MLLIRLYRGAGAGGVNLSATIASRGQMSAGLKVEKPLAATVASRGQVSAALAVEKPLAATVASRGTISAALRVEKPLAATFASVGRMLASLAVGGGEEPPAVVTAFRTLLGVGE